MTTAILPYTAILGARFRMMLQYRAAALAGLGTQIFFGFILIMIYEAFYESSGNAIAHPMTMRQIVTYTWLGQALLSMLPWNADGEVRAMVRSGALAYELCRPVDLYNLWYARAIALRTAPTILRAAPMLIFAAFVLPILGLDEWRFDLPPTVGSTIAFAASILCAMLLGCAVTMLINISLIWTIGGEGIAMITTSAVGFFSGMLVPLVLFPDWMQPFLRWQPFAGLVDLPFRIYTGNIALADSLIVLLRQILWTIALVLLGRALLRHAMKRVVVQGG